MEAARGERAIGSGSLLWSRLGYRVQVLLKAALAVGAAEGIVRNTKKPRESRSLSKAHLLSAWSRQRVPAADGEEGGGEGQRPPAWHHLLYWPILGAACSSLPSSPRGPLKLKLITIVWAYNESN